MAYTRQTRAFILGPTLLSGSFTTRLTIFHLRLFTGRDYWRDTAIPLQVLSYVSV